MTETSPTIDLTAYGKSVVRTVTPIIVGWLVALAAKSNFSIDANVAYGYVAPVVSAVYYAVVRFAENKVPAIGVLLGVKGKPHYAPTIK
jgi:hypothetical protein